MIIFFYVYEISLFTKYINILPEINVMTSLSKDFITVVDKVSR